jgi:hypothetical protein
MSVRLPILTFAAALVFVGCDRRELPTWARVRDGIRGDDTIAGAPLPVGRCAAAPVIDGALDEACWAGAAIAGPFVLPGDGRPAAADDPVAAFARLAWDDRALYVGVVVFDKKPSSPFSREARDPHIWAEASGIELMLQPGDPGDNREYFELQVDVAGAVWDTRFDDYNQPTAGAGPTKTFGHEGWDARLERAVKVERGAFYAIEAALPWSQIAPARVAVPPVPGDVWRANLYSFRDGQRRALAWSPLRGQGNFHRASRFGRIRFVTPS